MKLRKIIKYLKRGQWSLSELPLKVSTVNNSRVQGLIKKGSPGIDYNSDPWIAHYSGDSIEFFQLDSIESVGYWPEKVYYHHRTTIGFEPDTGWDDDLQDYVDYYGGGCFMMITPWGIIRPATKKEIEKLETIYGVD